MAHLIAIHLPDRWLCVNVNCLSTSDVLSDSRDERAEDAEDDSDAQPSEADREEGGKRKTNLQQQTWCNGYTNNQAKQCKTRQHSATVAQTTGKNSAERGNTVQ